MFCNRKREVAQLHRSLVRHGFNAAALHGDMDQSARTAALDAFRKGEVALLIASDVAARGLDIPDVSHVFNFDVPHHADDYVHRIGRTGRAGRPAPPSPSWRRPTASRSAAIEKLIGQSIPGWTSRRAAPPAKRPHPRASIATKASRRRAREHRRAAVAATSAAATRAVTCAAPHAPSHRERPPAPVTRIEEARPRREPKPARAGARFDRSSDEAGSHLPAFLLRPVRAKA